MTRDKPKDAAALPPLAEGEVHLWYGQTPAQAEEPWLKGLAASLSPAEQRRIDQIGAWETRREAILVQATLRRLLGAYLQAAPSSLVFGRGPYGKPCLLAPEAGLTFNASHTGGMLIIGVARNRELGVDVERLDRPVSEVLLRKALAPVEQEGIAALPEEARAPQFLAHWTLKEAYLKCLGIGLRLRPSKLAFGLSPPRLLETLPAHPGPVQCWQAPVSKYLVALVVAGDDAPAVRLQAFPEDYFRP